MIDDIKEMCLSDTQDHDLTETVVACTRLSQVKFIQVQSLTSDRGLRFPLRTKNLFTIDIGYHRENQVFCFVLF